MRTAHIFGATGLVGGCLLRALLAEGSGYDRVSVYVRRDMGLRQPRLAAHIVDFDRLDTIRGALAGGDVFCCLGTTIKKAGSQAAFERVDREYPVRIAEIAREDGAARMLVVSAMGADPNSRIFYNRVKGRMEEEVQAAGVRPLFLLRPSLLLGKREEFRLGERLAIAVSGALPFLFAGGLAKYKPIAAEAVARAMLRAASEPERGARVLDSREIAGLAAR